jgi:hypothetical protein
MCSLRFVWKVKDAALIKVCQQPMCSPWTHCLTPKSPDFKPSDFFVSWGTFCAFSTHETHDLHANVIVRFTRISSETLIDTLEVKAPGWDISSDVSVMGLTLWENCPVCVGWMWRRLHIRMEEIMFYNVSVFSPPLPESVHIFVFRRNLDRIPYYQLQHYVLGFHTPSWECL